MRTIPHFDLFYFFEKVLKVPKIQAFFNHFRNTFYTFYRYRKKLFEQNTASFYIIFYHVQTVKKPVVSRKQRFFIIFTTGDTGQPASLFDGFLKNILGQF